MDERVTGVKAARIATVDGEAISVPPPPKKAAILTLCNRIEKNNYIVKSFVIFFKKGPKKLLRKMLCKI